MPDLVFDACVVSNFALTESLRLLQQAFGGRCFLTDHVYMEILRGIRSGHNRLAGISSAMSAGWLEKIELRSIREKAVFERLTESLGLGEAASIAVAASRRLVFACDDLVARREAEKIGVLLTGTLGILKGMVRRKIIAVREADRLLNEMIKNGFYSPIQSIRDIR